jgi:hypothetical protein
LENPKLSNLVVCSIAFHIIKQQKMTFLFNHY